MAVNERVRPEALKLTTKSVQPASSAFVRKGAGTYVPKNAPIQKPILSQGLLRDGLSYAKNIGSKVASYVGKSALPAVTRFAASKTGLGTLATGAYALGDYINSDQAFNGANNADPRYTIKAPTIGGIPQSAVAQAVTPPVVNKVTPPVTKDKSRRVPLSKDSLPPLMDANGNLIKPPAPLGEKPVSSVADVVESNSVPTVVPSSAIGRLQGMDGISDGGYSPSMYNGQPQAQDTFWGNLNRAGGYSAQEWNSMTPEQRIQAGAQKSNLASGIEMAGQIAGGLGAGAGIYGTLMNAKYQKKDLEMKKNIARAGEANTSAFAKAAGGTYQQAVI